MAQTVDGDVPFDSEIGYHTRNGLLRTAAIHAASGAGAFAGKQQLGVAPLAVKARQSDGRQHHEAILGA